MPPPDSQSVVQRYYASTLGRFLTPDPYVSSGGVANPQSGNRYAYVENDPLNLYDPTGLQAEGPPINPYQGILDLIAGNLRKQWLASLLNREIPEQLSDFERLRRERTAEFRMWSVGALQKLSAGCVKAFRGESPSAEGAHNHESLLEEMIHGVTSVDFLDLREESHRAAIIGDVFAGGYTGGDWGKSLLDWTGDQGQARAYQFGHSTIILGLSFTVPHTESGKRDVYTTMVHEMLHVFTQLDDRQLARHFGLAFQDAPGPAGMSNSARAISEWMRNDCRK